MKRMTFLILFFVLCSWLSAQIVIGNGSQMQYSPLSSSNVYKRAVALYLADEINRCGTIGKIALNAALINPNLGIPFKIYLKHSSASSLNAVVWDQLLEGSAPVFSSSVLVSEPGWLSFDIEDFEYNGMDNLLVFFESGAAILAAPNPQWYYSLSSPVCLYARRASNSGFVNYLSNSYQRPNIRLDFEEAQFQLQIQWDTSGMPVLVWDAIPGCSQYQVLCSADPFAPQPWQVLDTVDIPLYLPHETFYKMFFSIRGIYDVR